MSKLILVLTEEGKKFENVPLRGKRLPLEQQPQDVLLDFAIIARKANRKDYIDLFKDLPSLEDLQSARADKNLGAIVDSGIANEQNVPPHAQEAATLQGDQNPAKANTQVPPIEDKKAKKI